MTGKIRLNARQLQLGNVKLFYLLFLTAAAGAFAVNLLPLVYEKTLSVMLGESIPLYRGAIDFAVAAVLFFAAAGVCFAISSSVERYFFVCTEKKDFKMSSLFYYFKLGVFWKNFSFRGKMFLFKGAAFAVCMLPFLLSALSFISQTLGSVSLNVCAVTGIAAAAFLFVGLLFYYRFTVLLFLCKYYFYKGQKLSFFKLINESVEKMVSKKETLTKIRLSFSGWFLLCVFVVPIPYVWSYYKQSLAVAAKSFMNS